MPGVMPLSLMIQFSDNERRFWLGLMAVPAGLILAPLAFFCAAYVSWGCHSDAPMAMTFPYPMLLHLAGVEMPDVVGLLILAVQFPFYLVVLATARDRGQFVRRLLGISAAHLCALAVCFVLWWLASDKTTLRSDTPAAATRPIRTA